MKGYSRCMASLRSAMDEMRLKRGTYRIDENKCVPIKVRIRTWRAVLDKLPTKTNLIRKGVLLDNDLCPLCNSHPETVNHLFVECDKAIEARGVINTWWKVFASNGRRLDEILIADGDNNRKVSTIKSVILHAYIWLIWKSRNTVAFKGTPCNPRIIANDVQSESFLWIKNRSVFGNSWNWLEWRCNPDSM